MTIRSLSAVVLLIAVITVAIALALSSRDFSWLFTTSMGVPLAEEQVFWWLLLLPLGVGAAAITSLCVVLSVRRLRSRAWLKAVDSAAIGFLGVLALSGALSVGHRWAMLKHRPVPPPQPQNRYDVFIPEQWADLAYRPVRERRLGPLAATGVGLRDYPGHIPFDPFLLRRVTFVGLRAEQVEAALGPPSPREREGQPSYYMAHGPGWLTASLYLFYGLDERRTTVVVAERLVIHRPIY